MRPSPRTSDDREFTFDDRDFRRVCRMIREYAGIHLHPHKRDMVYSRLARRVRALDMDRFGDYLDFVEADPDAELQGFINALTTNLTSFFREAHHFDMLADLLRSRGTGGQRIWCNAASTGEEPYTLAITACEAFGTMTPPVRILATDIDTHVLQTAARGVYPVERINALSLQRRRQFFQRGNGANAGMCRVKPELQALIEFRPLNLLDDDYGLKGGFDAVFCRNVMIYFDKATQYQVLQRMAPLIAPGGLLFAGHSESFGHAHDLITSCGRTTYRPVAGLK
ncbi:MULTISPECIES: CheR family methyltransferase [unclassified Lysobacter]|uniref:CheR family methyltransferase n=1 Tax=unclassified Lysobacter TaxID=2635362 RepID=UPI001C2195C8|nr:CheR family methyltransferase [Lysobacter sp. MMG2]MBU8976780.1 chemotaxis protein CheR [Lysobacter sp. MMG2]